LDSAALATPSPTARQVPMRYFSVAVTVLIVKRPLMLFDAISHGGNDNRRTFSLSLLLQRIYCTILTPCQQRKLRCDTVGGTELRQNEPGCWPGRWISPGR